MEGSIILCVLNAKHVHASPAPWCLAAGVKAYQPALYDQVKVVEATINEPPDDIFSRIIETTPSIIGFSCYLWNIKMTLALCIELKKALPDLIIVLGGPEVSYCAYDVLESNAQIDYILAGEGETSFPAFAAAILSQDKAGLLQKDASSTIAGLCGRRHDGSIYTSEECVLQENVPSPMDAGYAEAIQKRIAYIETSRGCPYSCAFCLSGRCGSPRFFPLESVFKDLIRIANSGARTIKFVDRTFNANPTHANRILQFILDHYGDELPRGTCFHFEIAGDILREETFLLLQKMPVGAVQLEIGMQSFCEKTLEAVKRKTNTTVLKANIRRLMAMDNMHIHIDLIAGLPYEDMTIFSDSFNTAYALKAQMLQVGFLKLLHGSAMRSEPQNYPCEYSSNPPYEVTSTPWMSNDEFEILHYVEDMVDRIYNSGRFRHTAQYALNAARLAPFDLYMSLGHGAYEAKIGSGISLDEFTVFLKKHLLTIDGIEEDHLRDALVRDRLSTNAGRLPPCLVIKDDLLSNAKRKLTQSNPPGEDVRRGVALLYGAKTLCWVDHHPLTRNPITNSWPINEVAIDSFL